MKTILFFGAGASFSDGAPLQKYLLTEYFKMRKTKRANGISDEYFPDDNKTSLMQLYTEELITCFLTDYFGVDFTKDMDAIVFPTFEEILGLIDNANQYDVKLRKYEQTEKKLAVLAKELIKANQQHVAARVKRQRQQEQAEGINFLFPNMWVQKDIADKISRLNIRTAFILLMAEVLHYTLQINPSETCHYKLINNLRDNIAEVNFFSTNYDLLIDSALVNNGFKINYNFDEREKDKANLFKLHGTLNFLYCPTCKQIMVYGVEKIVAKLLEHDIPCMGCRTKMEYIIIAPTYLKEFKNKYLQRIWSNAELLLRHNAEHIIFCGYSFPDADFHIKYLLKQAQIISFPSVKRISIVNGKKSNEDELNRYKRFFGSSIEVVNTELTFKEFAENPKLIVK